MSSACTPAACWPHLKTFVPCCCHRCWGEWEGGCEWEPDSAAQEGQTKAEVRWHAGEGGPSLIAKRLAKDRVPFLQERFACPPTALTPIRILFLLMMALASPVKYALNKLADRLMDFTCARQLKSLNPTKFHQEQHLTREPILA